MTSKTFSNDWLDENASYHFSRHESLGVVDYYTLDGVGFVIVIQKGDKRSIIAQCEPEEIIERFNAAKSEKLTGTP